MKLRWWYDLPSFMKTRQVLPYWKALSRRQGQLVAKRIFDVVAAAILLCLLAIPMGVIAAMIKADSKGPVFYRQERVTRYGKHFRIHKFRTMVSDADRIGTAVTVQHDSRITRMGAKLRGHRLDELPQLIDVLTGNMSFVGTRPEAVKYVEAYAPEYYATLLMPAGITSECSIRYKDEDQLLDGALDVDRVYLEQVLPAKMQWNLDSLMHFSFLEDLKTMGRTVLAVLGKEYGTKENEVAPGGGRMYGGEAALKGGRTDGSVTAPEGGRMYGGEAALKSGRTDGSVTAPEGGRMYGGEAALKGGRMDGGEVALKGGRTVGSVTFGVIAYNEHRYLPDVLRDLLDQTYPHERIEVILVDGDSEDDTLQIMKRFQQRYAAEFRDIKVLVNPKRTQPSGWNVVIGASTCDILLRIDAHARLPRDFVERNVACLDSGEDVCGGPRVNIIDGDTPWKRTLLCAEQSMFGAGFAAYRNDTKEKRYVDSVFHGAYRKSVIEQVGLFREELIRTEDNEYHHRIRSAGYRICYDPRIQSYYQTRSSLKGMLKQKFSNGCWIGRTLYVCPGCISLFHLVPFAFVCMAVITGILGCFGIGWPAAVLWILYAAANLCMTTVGIMQQRQKSVHLLCLPVIFLLLHLGYGIGTLAGLLTPGRVRKAGNQPGTTGRTQILSRHETGDEHGQGRAQIPSQHETRDEHRQGGRAQMASGYESVRVQGRQDRSDQTVGQRQNRLSSRGGKENQGSRESQDRKDGQSRLDGRGSRNKQSSQNSPSSQGGQGYDSSFLGRLRRANVKELLQIWKLPVAALCGCIYRIRHKDLWIVCEDPNEARDNGYWFFRYVRRVHPEQECVYAIRPASPDYEKVASIGRTVDYGSLRHWILYLASSKKISSQKAGNPNAAIFYFLEVYGILKDRRIFLQHGVIINELKWLYYDVTKMRRFICGAYPEYEFIRDTFGYPEGHVVYTGICRFDGLHRGVRYGGSQSTLPADSGVRQELRPGSRPGVTQEVQQRVYLGSRPGSGAGADGPLILIMPTWREWIADEDERLELYEGTRTIRETNYFRTWSAFIMDEELSRLAVEYGARFVFFPHRNMQKYLKDFPRGNAYVEIAHAAKYDVQGLMKAAAMMVTDYSSVFMDMVYMKKPVAFYQFDLELFRQAQYGEGYFHYDDNPFGRSFRSKDEVFREIETRLQQHFQVSEAFEKAHKEYFPCYDAENCKRVYEVVKRCR